MRDILSLLPYLLFQFGLFYMLIAFPAFLLIRWCLRRNFRLISGLVLAAMAACALMCVYGVLRFTGVVILPGDNDYSYHLLDTTWRDHGAALLVVYGAFLTSIIAAIVSFRRAGTAK